MPTYSLRQHDNGTWYIHWTENRRSKRQSTGQTEKTKAQIFLGEWLTTDAGDANGAPVYTVADLWQVYHDKHVEKNCADRRSFKTCWNNLRPHFGALALPDVAEKVEEYVALRTSGKLGRSGRPAKSGTVRGELARMLACFNWHADPKRKTIGVADVPVFEMPAASKPRDRWLRVDEVKKVMAAAADHSLHLGDRMSRVERFLWLALETAARRQAILELTWDRVDFDVNVIDYRVPGRVVTKKKRAVVPISTTLRPILLRAYEERQGALVCDNESHSIWRAVKSVAKRAGVERVSPHVLRHTAATHMLRNGVPIWTVAGVLGDTVETVQRVYGHHVPDAAAGAVEMLAGKLLAPTLQPDMAPTD